MWIPTLKWALNTECNTPSNVLGGLATRMTVTSANSTFWHVTPLPGCGRGCAQAIEANKASKPCLFILMLFAPLTDDASGVAETQELSVSWHFLSLVTHARILAQSADRLAWSVVAPAVARVFPEKNPDREAYSGETHVHTSWSFDAYIFGNHIAGPAEAYEYATGQSIKHPYGYEIKITTPLDWMGVTDHWEYVGTIRLANEPGSAINRLPIAHKLMVHTPADIQKVYLLLGKA